MINSYIKALVNYGLSKGFFKAQDKILMTNRILEALNLDNFDDSKPYFEGELKDILAGLTDYAVSKGIIEDSITYRDIFDTKLMGLMLPNPSAVTEKFNEIYKSSGAKAATDYYYKFSCDTNYIRCDRIKKDMKWIAPTPYGDLDITINLSKPEKDPKAIAAAKNAPQRTYPLCQLCKENEGYTGFNYPARQNHRIIPITINNSPWMFQYSPYVYYNEHCIVFNSKHTPMAINNDTFVKLFDFVKLFPHYFVGSNADLPIVGGSILSHDHFQGGHYTFAMAKAPIKEKLTFKGFEDIEAGILKWPMSVIRLKSENTERIIELAGKILTAWRSYTDKDAFIFAETNGEKHNTITPIARYNSNKYELDLVLRNNITTEEHPLGVYHPHAELHHIKKENIGLIEVMGLAVLPARLKKELSDLADAIINKKDIEHDDVLSKHYEWTKEILNKHKDINKDNIDSIIKEEVGIVFAKVLEHAGVYKQTEEGIKAFKKFTSSI